MAVSKEGRKMIAQIEKLDGTYEEKEMGEPICGRDFCDECGECLVCGECKFNVLFTRTIMGNLSNQPIESIF